MYNTNSHLQKAHSVKGINASGITRILKIIGCCTFVVAYFDKKSASKTLKTRNLIKNKRVSI
jgi:hypothetical protein